MAEDFQRGNAQGQFEIADIQAAVDFIKGASLAGVYAVSQGVAQPHDYMDAAVGMLMCAIGCQADLRLQAIAFSRKHLDGWCNDGQTRFGSLAEDG